VLSSCLRASETCQLSIKNINDYVSRSSFSDFWFVQPMFMSSCFAYIHKTESTTLHKAKDAWMLMASKLHKNAFGFLEEVVC